jgi:hypothetical protein
MASCLTVLTVWIKTNFQKLFSLKKNFEKYIKMLQDVGVLAFG